MSNVVVPNRTNKIAFPVRLTGKAIVPVMSTAATALPLLDGVTATINACYSMRSRLLSAYSGSLFELTRASDSATLDIGFASGTDVADVAAITTFLTATTGTVTKWYDQSSNGYTLDAVNAPNYDATGLNSLGSMDFVAGSAHYLRRTTGLLTAYPITVYATCQADGASPYRTLWSTADEAAVATHYACVVAQATQGALTAQERAGGTTGFATSNFVITTPHICEARFVSAASRFSRTHEGIIDTENTTNTSGPPLGLDSVTVGVFRYTALGGYMDGDIGEIVELSSTPSTSDRNIVGNFLSTLRGETWADA